MSEFKGTVGNWVLIPSIENGIAFEIWNDRKSEDKQVCIASIYHTPFAEEKENASLLLTAPKLLEALQSAIRFVRHNHNERAFPSGIENWQIIVNEALNI